MTCVEDRIQQNMICRFPTSQLTNRFSSLLPAVSASSMLELAKQVRQRQGIDDCDGTAKQHLNKVQFIGTFPIPSKGRKMLYLQNIWSRISLFESNTSHDTLVHGHKCILQSISFWHHLNKQIHVASCKQLSFVVRLVIFDIHPPVPMPQPHRSHDLQWYALSLR